VLSGDAQLLSGSSITVNLAEASHFRDMFHSGGDIWQ
jgi:hypothetical protein